MHLSHSNIEYVKNQDGTQGFGWNFYRGCLHKQQGKCPVAKCWAEHRVASRQGWDFHKPELLPECLLLPLRRKKPATFDVCFTGDLFGSWVDPQQWIDLPPDMFPLLAWNGTRDMLSSAGKLRYWVQYVVTQSTQHTFLFLTKNPAGIWPVKWPDNCWMAATVWDAESFYDATEALSKVKAKHKWLSIEPLLDQINGGECEGERLDLLKAAGIQWVVIGAQTRPDVMPDISWVREIVEACDAAGIPVWLKDNLAKTLMPRHSEDDAVEWAWDESCPSGDGETFTYKLHQDLPPPG